MLFASIGALLGSILACVPGMHVAGVLAVLAFSFGEVQWLHYAVPLSAGLIVSYCIIGFVPLVFLAVPDESLFSAVNPSQDMLREGKGMQALMLGGIGACTCIMITSAAINIRSIQDLLVDVFASLRPHWHWLIWSVTAYMLMSEWPQRPGPGLRPMARLFSAWRSLLPGLLVFILSAELGIIVFFGEVGMPETAFASIMPMVSGIFSVPWLVLSILKNQPIPGQSSIRMAYVSRGSLMTGLLAGISGGAFACLVPGVSAGVGGFLAGHMCSLNNRSAFVVAQGASRSAYMCGGLLLLFLPRGPIVRGGCSMMLAAVHDPIPQIELLRLVAGLLIAAALSLALLPLLGKLFLYVAERMSTRRIGAVALLIILLMNWYVTGTWGLAVLAVASLVGGAGMIYHARRMNCLGCILVPVGLSLSGWGSLFI